ncbi:MAG TPA: hypothetical protein VNZ57_06175 [Longimicrobiales bacterium]|nr:hypothetical protein [Longimicrobiales bacterium]
MARHATKRRAKQEVEGEDAFIARVLEITAWARANAKVLTIGTVAVVAVALGSLFFVNQRSARNSAAEVRLTEIRQTVAIGNTSLAISDLEAFLGQFGGTRAADDARLLLGTLYLETSQPANAVNVVQALAGNPGEVRGASAAFLLAAAQEALGQNDQAEATYMRIAQQARFDFERWDALDHVARLRMANGNAAGAAEIYERLVALMPEGSADRSYYEMRRAEAQVLAEAPPTPPAAEVAPAEAQSSETTSDT